MSSIKKSKKRRNMTDQAVDNISRCREQRIQSLIHSGMDVVVLDTW